MNSSKETFTPPWICSISACFWIFPFSLLSYLFQHRAVAFLLLLGYLSTFLHSFWDISIVSSDDFKDFPGWRLSQAVAIVPAIFSIHLFQGSVSLDHLSPSFFILLLIFLVWYFFLGQFPLIFLYPLAKFCVQTASKIYASSHFFLKLFSSFIAIIFCLSITFTLLSGTVPCIPSKKSSPETTVVTVWIPTHGGKCYHKYSSCSNMIDPRQISLTEAKEKGFSRCSKCW